MMAVNLRSGSKAGSSGMHQPRNMPELSFRRGGGTVPQFVIHVSLRLAMRLHWTGAIQLLMPIAMRLAWAAACSKRARRPWQPLAFLHHPFAAHRP